MSTEFGYICLSHDPHLHSDGLVVERDVERLRWVYRHRHDLIVWLNIANTDDSVIEPPAVNGCLSRPDAPIRFLREHFRCHIGIWSEISEVEELSDRIDQPFIYPSTTRTGSTK